MLLIIVVSVHSSSSTKDVAKTLGVHHKNLSATIDDNGFALWSLSMKKRGTNGLPKLLRKVVIDRWTSETHVSPNKSDVT